MEETEEEFTLNKKIEVAVRSQKPWGLSTKKSSVAKTVQDNVRRTEHQEVVLSIDCKYSQRYASTHSHNHNHTHMHKHRHMHTQSASVNSCPIIFFKYFHHSLSSKTEVGTRCLSNKEAGGGGAGGEGTEVGEEKEDEETHGSDYEHHIHVRCHVHSFPI